ncbi:MAG: ATP-independent helicase [Acidimicrobiales bacterium]|nr:ATP-independent helicase [Acidimicrobiales bacterium]
MSAVEPDDVPAFVDLGLRPELVDALATLGYEEPTPIQAAAIPPFIAGKDLLGQAATGTGKTAAFALPILERLEADRRSGAPMALVLVPTRELAMQVSEAIHRYGKPLGARVLPIFGGQPISRQLQALRRGIDVVVATPGRAIDHINRGTLPLDEIEVVVLDEADEMLDMGFAEDIESILTETPPTRQTVLFSATMPGRINAIAKRHLTDPTRIEIARPTVASGDAPKVRQTAYLVPRSHKPAALGRILDVESPTAAIVFCRTRLEVDELTETMNGRGYRAEALHGGMNQEQRDRVMNRLRGATADLLVATDVAARGLDIDQLTHVVNYDVPSAPESYVHRIGRVGRAGREGVAITLAEPRQHRMLKNIERITKQRITVEKVPTVADLRTRRMELTRATLEEIILEGGLDQFRAVVETLADEYDVMEVALAAVKLAHESSGAAADEEEIPDVQARPEGKDRKPWDKGDRGSKPGGKGAPHPKGDGARPARGASEGMTRLYVAAGRSAGIRPGDLVGAIAGETDLSGRDIGSIEIADRFSLVEVPEGAVDQVIDAMKRSVLKGKKVAFRRERYEA